MASKYCTKRICWFFIAAFLSSCATPTKARLDALSMGTDKAGVLDSAGNPSRSERRSGGDIWTYTYFIEDQKFERDLRFESGKLVSISDPREVPAASLGDDKVTKDYKQLVEEAKSKREP